MDYNSIKAICRKGYSGLIPGWLGYLKWDYSLDLIQFINGDFKMSQSELDKYLLDRTDLYYII